MAGVSFEQDDQPSDSTGMILTVPIAPRAASRPRFGKNGCVYTDSTYKQWLSDFQQLAMRLWEHPTVHHCNHLEVVFNGPTKRGDLDNYLKAALDGLVYAGVLKNDNLTVLDSIETRFIKLVGSDPWIWFKIQI